MRFKGNCKFKLLRCRQGASSGRAGDNQATKASGQHSQQFTPGSPRCMFSSPFGAPAPPPGPAAPNVKKKKELPNGFPELLLGNLFSKHFLSAASKVLDGLLITAEPAPLPSGPPDALFTPDVADAVSIAPHTPAILSVSALPAYR